MKSFVFLLLLINNIYSLTLDTNYIKHNHPTLDSISRIKNISICIKIVNYNSEGYFFKSFNDSNTLIHLFDKKVIELDRGAKKSKLFFHNVLSEGCYAFNKNRYELTNGCMCHSNKLICYYFNNHNDSLEISIDPTDDNKIDNALFYYKNIKCFFILRDEYIIAIRKAFKELSNIKNEGCCKE